ncbi:MAG: gliding motility-associated C-terminal domain-containing protein [Bacteroidales bacterium]
MNKYRIIIFILFILSGGVYRSARCITVKERKPSVPAIQFIENKTQWDSRVLYRARLNMGDVFLERNAMTYLLIDPTGFSSCHHAHEVNGKVQHDAFEERQVDCHAFTVNFLGANAMPEISTGGQFSFYYNYFLGNDPSRWASYVRAYNDVIYGSLYDGVDLKIGSSGSFLKYEFIVDAFVEAGLIRLKYTGVDQLDLIGGNLVVRNSVNDLVEMAPFAYQVIQGDTVSVPCNYNVEGSVVTFTFPSGYQKDLPLVIDPVVVASTYAGSNGQTTWGHTATYDTDGNIYTGARSFGYGYPTTSGAFQMSFGGGETDAGISKFNPDGSELIWASYLGGSGSDFSHSLVTNEDNELFVYGSTASTNFPAPAGCFQTNPGGSYDIFVTHFNVSGSALIGSTYVGGSQNDGQNVMTLNYGDEFRGEIILDNSGNPCVASFTSSANFPTTPGAYDQSHNGAQDGVVFKLSADLTNMLWSTFLGGSQNDAAFGLKLNIVDMVYVTGGTQSSNFPNTTWVLNPTYQGGTHDGFICIFQPDISSMISGTFFGTSGQDVCFFIQMDENNDVYVFGQSSGNMPVTTGCYGNAGSPQFIAKLDQTLNAVVWQTVFGSGNPANKISPTAFLVDVCSNIYVAGWGNTTGFPVTPDAVQSITDGKDFYLLALEANATQLVYGTFYGTYDPSAFGDHVDGGTSRFDKKGVIYEAVCACSFTAIPQFPTLPNAYQPSPPASGQYCDLAVFKIDFELSGPTAQIGVAPTNTGCVPFNPGFTNSSVNAQEYIWDFGDGSPTSSLQLPNHTYSVPGTYIVSCIAIDSSSCYLSDTAYQEIVVLTAPIVNLGPDTLLCGLDEIILDAGNTGLSFLWSTNSTNQQITVNSNGAYWVKVDNGTCSSSDTIQIEFMDPPELGPDTSLCSGLNLILNSNMTGVQYLWSTGALTPSITVNVTGTYTLSVSRLNCTLEDSIHVTFLPHPEVDLGQDTGMCQGQSLLLSAGFPGSTYQWNTGAITQNITVYSSNVYSVTVTANNCSGADSILITVQPLPLVNLMGDRVLCEGDTLYLDAGNPGSYFQWSTGDTLQQIMIADSGYYSVTVSNGGCSSSDTIYATMLVFRVDLGPDTLLCPGETITLDAGNPGYHYLWNTGQTERAINTRNSGLFWVRVYEGLCQASDTIRIEMLKLLELPQVLNLCGQESVTIESNIEGEEFLWSTGDDLPSIVVYEAGIYSLEVSSAHCTQSDSTLVIGKSGYSALFLPNTFTPNHDGVNDIFSGIGTDITYFNIKIFNRWGEMIFESSDMSEGWDGRYKGDIVPDGVYAYFIRYATPCSFEQKFKKEGYVLLLR